MKRIITQLNIEDPTRRIEFTNISGKGVKYRLWKPVYFSTGIIIPEEVSLGLITLHADGNMYLADDYAWNGPNVMRDKDKAMRASLGHDPLCELVADGLISKKLMPKINDLFKRWCMEDGMPEWEYKAYRYLLKSYWQGWFRPYKQLRGQRRINYLGLAPRLSLKSCYFAC